MSSNFKDIFFKTAVVVILGLSFLPFRFVQASESIPEYLTEITINQDSSINIQETITYDFGDAERHGIFRTIPYKYEARGGTFKLRLKDIKVTDAAGKDLEFTTGTSGGEVELKIGDPESTVTGKQQYKIHYRVQRAVNYFADHDELYWNVIGTGWDVPVDKVEALIKAPAITNKVSCFTGQDGSTEQSCSINGGNTETVTFATTRILQAHEGLTVVIGLPAGSLQKPSTTQKLKDILLDNGILALPILVLALMYYLWNRYGKDAKRKNAIVAQYEAPSGMSPMYIGSLLNNGMSDRNIAAEVIYLAEQGYLTIERIEKTKLLVFKGDDYIFTNLYKPSDKLAQQTQALLKAIFSEGQEIRLLSDLKDDRVFGASLMAIKGKMMTELVKDGYYHANPTHVKAIWMTLGIVGTVGLSFLLGNAIGYLGVISAVLSGLIVMVFSFLMPARTQKGADTAALIEGLSVYLTVAEKERLKFHNAPDKDPKHFEMLLPFAIALGVEQLWAAKFHDLTKAPSWYNDSTGSAFNVMAFSHSLNNFSGSMQSVAHSVTTASSGGSGFSGGGSGGGGGGGGGGSW